MIHQEVIEYGDKCQTSLIEGDTFLYLQIEGIAGITFVKAEVLSFVLGHLSLNLEAY